MSNQMKHTEGPWHRNIRADGKYPTVFASRNQHIAVAIQQKNGAETEANIDLIAAAPELLEALTYAAQCYCSEFCHGPTDDPHNLTCEKFQALIAKAEGRTP